MKNNHDAVQNPTASKILAGMNIISESMPVRFLKEIRHASKYMMLLNVGILIFNTYKKLKIVTTINIIVVNANQKKLTHFGRIYPRTDLVFLASFSPGLCFLCRPLTYTNVAFNTFIGDNITLKIHDTTNILRCFLPSVHRQIFKKNSSVHIQHATAKEMLTLIDKAVLWKLIKSPKPLFQAL
jgi:hypothetical protein